MSRWRRAVLTACILGLGAALGGCENFDIDKLTEMFENKKPIPGDRKPLFPQGVPGVMRSTTTYPRNPTAWMAPER